ncbi:MAG: leucine-rich repeat domain-containing protein, partial [Acutalibacteraceae bacterium]|nr:leucine-rich repeat domain-containing protein [Acutalibacteraceae bacterium]
MKVRKLLAALSALTLTVSATAGYFPAFIAKAEIRANAAEVSPQAVTAELPSVASVRISDEDDLKTADGWTYTVESNDESDYVRITGYTGTATELTVPEKIDGKPVTAIAERAFAGNKKLTALNLGKVQRIGSCIADGCTALKAITIPKTVKETGDWSDGCLQGSSIEKVTFEEGIANIPMYVCKNASSVKTVVLPEKEDTLDGYVIEESAFYGTSLTSITLPDSLTAIQGSVFEECALLTEIKMGDNVDYIGDYC